MLISPFYGVAQDLYQAELSIWLVGCEPLHSLVSISKRLDAWIVWRPVLVVCKRLDRELALDRSLHAAA